MVQNNSERQWKKIVLTLLVTVLLCAGVSGSVLAASKKIALNHTKLTLNLYDASVKLQLCNARGSVKWSSSNKKIVAVKNGVLTVKHTGKCVIKAKHNKKVYTCQVTVQDVSKRKAFKILRKRYQNAVSEKKIVLAGGSNLRMWGANTKALPSKDVVNAAVGGSRIIDWKRNYKELIVKQNPKAVVLYVGANDLGDKTDRSGKSIGQDICELLEMITGELPDVPVFYVSVLPSPARWNSWKKTCVSSKMIKNYCSAKNNVYYIDCDKEFLNKKGKPKSGLFRPDGVHLNKKGQKIWNQLIAKKVKKILK